MNKFKCFKCGLMATWYYMPWSESKNENESYFCDDCVKRGCSCNINYYSDLLTQEKDELGRLLPCCEYNYCEFGYDET